MLGQKVPTFSALCKSRKISRTNPSYHYIKRIDRKKPVKSYAKQSTLSDVKQMTFVAIRIRSKPRHDIKDKKYLLFWADIQTTLLGDTAYDSEKEYHQRSLIESGFGSLKRKYGGYAYAIDWKAIRNEAYLKAIAHNWQKLGLGLVEIFN